MWKWKEKKGKYFRFNCNKFSSPPRCPGDDDWKLKNKVIIICAVARTGENLYIINMRERKRINDQWLHWYKKIYINLYYRFHTLMIERRRLRQQQWRREMQKGERKKCSDKIFKEEEERKKKLNK